LQISDNLLPMLHHRFGVEIPHLGVDSAHGVVLRHMSSRSGGHAGEQGTVAVNLL
jgi:hypothetical protein